jgi:hypothetical protein
MKVSKARKDGSFDGLLALNIVSSIGFALALHAAFLLTNVVASVTLCLSKESRKAIIIVSSQKVLSLAVTVLLYLPNNIGDKGLIVLPLIISHLTQIIVDAVIASLWPWFERKQVQKDEREMGERGEVMEEEVTTGNQIINDKSTTEDQLEERILISDPELGYKGKKDVVELERQEQVVSTKSDTAKIIGFEEYFVIEI